MYQFSSPLAPAQTASVARAVNNSFSVAMQQLAVQAAAVRAAQV